jgi:hypothetical protein
VHHSILRTDGRPGSTEIEAEILIRRGQITELGLDGGRKIRPKRAGKVGALNAEPVRRDRESVVPDAAVRGCPRSRVRAISVDHKEFPVT